MTPGSGEVPPCPIVEIMTLAGRALEVADAAKEHLLGAKLSEVLFHARARLTGIEDKR